MTFWCYAKCSACQKSKKWFFFSMFFMLISFLLTGCGKGEEDSGAEYMVLIGEGPEIAQKISNVDLLVIDAQDFSGEEIAALRDRNVEKIYSYLNIGSIETYRPGYDHFEPYALGEYENWPQEKWMDVAEKEWKDYLLEQAGLLAEKGVDGFFLDNIDVYYRFPNEDIYRGIVDILRGLRQIGRGIILNGGDVFVSRYLQEEAEVLFDGINQEDVYTTYDFESGSFGVNTEKDREYFALYLDELLGRGYDVYVTEYAKDGETADAARLFAQQHRYECYVSDNIELRMNGA